MAAPWPFAIEIQGANPNRRQGTGDICHGTMGRPARIFGALAPCSKAVLCGGTFEDSISRADATRRETQGVRARTATTRMGSSGAPIRSLVSLDTAPLRCETLWVRLIGADRVGFGVSRSRSCCSSVAETSSTRRTEQLRVQYL